LFNLQLPICNKPKILPSTMAHQAKPGRLVVCERTGRWAVALRREMAETGIRVWETRTLDDCGLFLAESPASFALLELNPQKIQELLDFIRAWRMEYSSFRLAVAAERDLASYKWLMLEAGAVEFIYSTRQIGNLARTACRHLALVPSMPQSLSERIWSNLPWGRAG
jgi:hypothetical protein